MREPSTEDIALGRKNFLCAGSDTSSDRATSLYIIVQTDKLNGVTQKSTYTAY